MRKAVAKRTGAMVLYAVKAIFAALACVGFVVAMTVIKDRVILNWTDFIACKGSGWDFLIIIPVISVTLALMALIHQRKKQKHSL